MLIIFSSQQRDTRDTWFDVYKVELVCLQVCRQFPGFLNNSIRVYSIKLNLSHEQYS